MTDTRTAANERTFVTPEGVDLRLSIADAGQRIGAFLLDAAIMVAVLLVGTFGLLLLGVGALGAAGESGAEVVAIVWLFGFFVLRNFYFTGFELTAAAATPGKRMLGLRVAARDGGRLTAQSVFARNAMRELEVFLPLTVLFGSGSESNGWLTLAILVWVGVFVLFPLFNRDRLRLGDIIGGTWVVRAPRIKLLRDMADDGSDRVAHFAFTPAQLDAYGAKELHVLEEVLRQRDRKVMAAVANRIALKIGWSQRTDESAFDFLSAYYAGLRGRLEQRLLMGVRRKDKFDV